ncbi:MAG: class I SAM-dependent methyltransferase [Acidobacteriota bacterium]
MSDPRHAPWQPTEILLREERRRVAARLLRRVDRFPRPGDACLEIGYGRIGWLGDLLSWGLRSADLHGIEIDPDRAAVAHEALPGADLRVGDARALPWPNATFRLVVVSTVFTSILDDDTRRAIAAEIERVLAPAGALLWYDFRVDNPRNPRVRRVGRRTLRHLFPRLVGPIQSVSLAPPIARLVAPLSHRFADVLAAVPFLRTHLLAVLTPRDARASNR